MGLSGVTQRARAEAQGGLPPPAVSGSRSCPSGNSAAAGAGSTLFRAAGVLGPLGKACGLTSGPPLQVGVFRSGACVISHSSSVTVGKLRPPGIVQSEEVYVEAELRAEAEALGCHKMAEGVAWPCKKQGPRRTSKIPSWDSASLPGTRPPWARPHLLRGPEPVAQERLGNHRTQ